MSKELDKKKTYVAIHKSIYEAVSVVYIGNLSNDEGDWYTVDKDYSFKISVEDLFKYYFVMETLNDD